MRPFETQATRRALQYMVVTLLLVVAPTVAQADFSGDFAPSNWSLTNSDPSGNGTVNTASAPAAITVIGADLPSPIPGPENNTDFVLTLLEAGQLSFDFAFATPDVALFDDGGFLLNGIYTPLADADGESGIDQVVDVLAGDVFGFRVHSVDSNFGAGSLTISNFSFTPEEETPVPSIPEPSTLVVVGLGAAAFALRRLGRRGK